MMVTLSFVRQILPSLILARGVAGRDSGAKKRYTTFKFWNQRKHNELCASRVDQAANATSQRASCEVPVDRHAQAARDGAEG